MTCFPALLLGALLSVKQISSDPSEWMCFHQVLLLSFILFNHNSCSFSAPGFISPIRVIIHPFIDLIQQSLRISKNSHIYFFSCGSISLMNDEEGDSFVFLKVGVDVSKWLSGHPDHSFEYWKRRLVRKAPEVSVSKMKKVRLTIYYKLNISVVTFA